MYISASATIAAIKCLKESVHPFVGITYLACKRYGLPIGVETSLSLDAVTRSHLDQYHLLDRKSTFFFQPFRGAKWWVDKRYPSSGLQTINTQTFSEVFLHYRNSRTWGFAVDYLNRTRGKLQEISCPDRLPADALAIWFFKGGTLGDTPSVDGLIAAFFAEFQVTQEEQESLFSARFLNDADDESIFSDEPLSMTDILRSFSLPPDAAAEGGRTISSLEIKYAGPSEHMQLEFGERLSLITGDNGLGKSFLLDFAWWAATGAWAGREVVPMILNAETTPSVTYDLRGWSGALTRYSAHYDRSSLSWSRARTAMTVEALAVYSRADGSFAIADPVRRAIRGERLDSINLLAQEVWDGRRGIIEGLIRDWTKWQSSSDKLSFDRFSAVLKRLSPDDLGTLTPGAPIRLPGDPRDIPTITHRYGTIPITQTSSGVQRVLLLAYLIIWSWQEHEIASQQVTKQPLRRMLVIVDELEAHLHPKWQRIVLPALMSVSSLLSSDLAIQMICATHSPMILASMEATFDAELDTLYHLYGDGPRVRLDELPFVKYGDVSGWLTSPVFGLRHARSREAERAIEDAKGLQLSSDVTADTVREVSDRLKLFLASDDKFWPRWLYFAESHGVML